MINVIIYPISVKLNKNNKPEKIITKHTENEWKKLLKELKKSFQNYEIVYGIKIAKVRKLNDNFIEVKFVISNEKKYQKYGNRHNIGETFVSFTPLHI